jgi:hypothetical protein
MNDARLVMPLTVWMMTISELAMMVCWDMTTA